MEVKRSRCTAVVPPGCAISILGDLQDLRAPSPEQPGGTPELTLLGREVQPETSWDTFAPELLPCSNFFSFYNVFAGMYSLKMHAAWLLITFLIAEDNAGPAMIRQGLIPLLYDFSIENNRLHILLRCLTSGEMLANILKKYINDFAVLCRQQKKFVERLY